MSKKKTQEEITTQAAEETPADNGNGKFYKGTAYLTLGTDGRIDTLINLSAIAWAHRFGNKLEITFVGSDVPTPFHFAEFEERHWQEMWNILAMQGGGIFLPGEEPGLEDGEIHG